MPKPQDPNLRRSGQVPALDPDATESELEGRDRPEVSGSTGPVPPDNRPERWTDSEPEDAAASSQEPDSDESETDATGT